MEDHLEGKDNDEDIFNQINFDYLFNNLEDFDDLFPSSSNQLNSSPSSGICDEIEAMLMKDEEDDQLVIEESHNHDFCLDFFADVLPDVLHDESRDDKSTADSKISRENEGKDEEISVFDRVQELEGSFEDQNKKIRVLNDDKLVSGSDVSIPVQEEKGSEKERFCAVPANQFEEIRVLNVENSNPGSNVSDDDSEEKDEEKNGENDDPISKKRKRQIRNRDAAIRSRERKKLYVRDLEMKSKYLEGECIRLQRLLQCTVAENHTLHYQLQSKAAFSASKTKQESAVLFLESLLLGSLLWFLGILGLCSLLPLLHLMLPEAMMEKVGSKSQEVAHLVVLRRTESERTIGLGSLRLFFKSKRCKASRSKMKTMFYFGAVLA